MPDFFRVSLFLLHEKKYVGDKNYKDGKSEIATKLFCEDEAESFKKSNN